MNKAREQSGCDAVLCVMSGNFSQRAEPTVFDMWTRTKAALACGADLVVELPTLYASSCAERFSEGAINIINSINGVTHLAFGSESGNINFLKAVAEIQANETDDFKKVLKSELDSGKGYAHSLASATKAELKKKNVFLNNTVNSPNEILGIEYIKQLIKTGSKITPLTIKREGACHHDSSITSENFVSASYVRTQIANENFDSITNFIPYETINIYKNSLTNMPNKKLFDTLAIESILNRNFTKCPDCQEGLENRLLKSAQKYFDLENVISDASTKRYTSARLRRLAFQAVLCVTYYPILSKNDVIFKVLGINKKLSSKLLPALSNNAIKRNRDLNDILSSNLSQNSKQTAKYITEIDRKANNIYSLICNKLNQYYTTPLIEF